MVNRISESVEAVQRKAKCGTCGEHEVGYVGGAAVRRISLERAGRLPSGFLR